jgi:hypothetical protein
MKKTIALIFALAAVQAQAVVVVVPRAPVIVRPAVVPARPAPVRPAQPAHTEPHYTPAPVVVPHVTPSKKCDPKVEKDCKNG